MGSFYRRPEELRIEISDGNWLLVRKHLTAGEARQASARFFKTIKPGETPEVDLEHYGIPLAVAYLIDWSITDVNDKPIVIRGQSPDFVAASLSNMTPEGMQEILKVIETHDAAMIAERELQKKASTGTPEPSLTSTSAA